MKKYIIIFLLKAIRLFVHTHTFSYIFYLFLAACCKYIFPTYFIIIIICVCKVVYVKLKNNLSLDSARASRRPLTEALRQIIIIICFCHSHVVMITKET